MTKPKTRAELIQMARDFSDLRFARGFCYERAFQDIIGQLVLKPDSQPAYRLAPHHGRRFRIVELEGFVVEFRGEGTIVDDVIFHQPNGTFVARRLEDSG